MSTSEMLAAIDAGRSSVREGKKAMTEATPDISTVPADLTIPALSEGEPSAGKRVKQRLPGWPSPDVYHVIYLPPAWAPGKSYPLLVEYTGNGGYVNAYGD